MDEGGRVTLLLLLIAAQGESLLESPDQLTWVEAQSFCRDRNSALIPGTKEDFPTPHWTALYHRLSDWIHVLGCYESEAVTDLVVLSNHTLERGSVGLCQERCGSKSFALQNTTCLCLQDTIQAEGVSTTRCDWNCSYDDDSHVNDCGGSGTFNVYKVTPRDARFPSERTVNCVVLGCYEQYRQIHTDNCTDDLGRVCSSEAGTNKTIAPNEENFKSWSQTYAECRDTGSYLYGNLSLFESPKGLCTRLYDIKSNTPETWLGVARQIYLTKDRGEQLMEVSVIDCHICLGQGGCSYEDMCNSTSVKATALCGDESDLLSQTKVTSTPIVITEAPAPSTDDDSDLAIAIVIPVVILVILFAVVGVVCIRRRRKEQEKREDAPRKKYEDNILYESNQSKGSLTKENGNGETIQTEFPQTVAKIKDVTCEMEPPKDNLTNGTDNKPEREQVVGDTSGDEVQIERTVSSDIKQQPTVHITTEDETENKQETENINNGVRLQPADEISSKNKAADSNQDTENMNSDIRLQPADQITSENKADNNQNTEHVNNDINNEMTENAPQNTENKPEDNSNDTKQNSDSKDIASSDRKLQKKIEESNPQDKKSPEKTSATKTELNAPLDTNAKDSGIRLPLIKSSVSSTLLRTTATGNAKKNVSVIQVTKI